MIIYCCSECKREYSKEKKPYDERCEKCRVYLTPKYISDDEDGSSFGVSPSAKEGLTKQVDQNNNTYQKNTQSQQSNESSNKIDTQVTINTNDSDEYKSRRVNKRVNNLSNSNDVNTINSTINAVTNNVVPNNVTSNFSSSYDNYIEGKVVSVNEDSGFVRYPWEKLSDKYCYGQRVSNIQNTITIRKQGKDGKISDEQVLFYGQIKGGAGIIHTGMSIKVYGKYDKRKNFMAKQIIMGDKTTVSIRTEIMDYIYYALPLLAVLMFGMVISLVNGIGTVVRSIDITSIIIPFLIIFSVAMWGIGKVTRMQFASRVKISLIIAAVIGGILLFC